MTKKRVVNIDTDEREKETTTEIKEKVKEEKMG
jgi:hypothetical protein